MEGYDTRAALQLQGQLGRHRRRSRAGRDFLRRGGSRRIGRVQVQEIRLHGEHAQEEETHARGEMQLPEVPRGERRLFVGGRVRS